MRAKCNLDCFNCKYDDCINDKEMDNSIYCARWYAKNREKKLEYQKAYNKQKRANKPTKNDKPLNIPKSTKLSSFRELGTILGVI